MATATINTRVTVVPQSLETTEEKLLSFFGGLIFQSIRATIVWGIFAIFFPVLGVNWIMAYAAIILIHNLKPIDPQQWIALVKKTAAEK